MKNYVIEIQSNEAEDAEINPFSFIVRDARTGLIYIVGHDVTDLQEWLDCFLIDKD